MVNEARAALERDDYVSFFEAVGFKVCGTCRIGCGPEDNGIELEAYTDAGEDMIVSIEVNEDWKADFREYVEGFDINENVRLWWAEGEEKARESGLPFDSPAEQVEDYKDWVAWLKNIVCVMDGKDPVYEDDEPTKEAIDAVRKWAYWCSNYTQPEVWAKEIWAGWEADHFIEKFNDAKSMDQFFRQLDHGNQEKLAKYVLEHYEL